MYKTKTGNNKTAIDEPRRPSTAENEGKNQQDMRGSRKKKSYKLLSPIAKNPAIWYNEGRMASAVPSCRMIAF